LYSYTLLRESYHTQWRPGILENGFKEDPRGIGGLQKGQDEKEKGKRARAKSLGTICQKIKLLPSIKMVATNTPAGSGVYKEGFKMTEIMALKTNIRGLFNCAMSHATAGERLIYLATAFRDAPAGVLLDFAEHKRSPIFAGHFPYEIIGAEKIETTES